MSRKIQWKAIILGFLARCAVENALNAVLYVFFRSYMLLLGAGPFWLYERFRRTPIGYACGALALLAAYWVLGFVIGHFSKRAPFFNIGFYLFLEAVLSLIVIGLEMPRHFTVTFGESLVGLLCLVAAFVGGLCVDQVVKRHANY